MKYELEAKTAARLAPIANWLWNASLGVLVLFTPVMTILLTQHSLVSSWI